MKIPTFFPSRGMRAAAALLLALSAPFLSQCENYRPDGGAFGYAGAIASPGSAESVRSAKPTSVRSRPGLGTSAGNDRHDPVKSTVFYRRMQATPDATATIHYNDEDGARTMAEAWGGGKRPSGGTFEIAGGRLEARIVTGRDDDTCPHYEVSGNRTIVVGKPGESWQLELENESDERLEVVVSVDGLDVMSGKPAKVSGHGYVIEKDARIRIAGWRVDSSTVKRFLFGTVAESKAAAAGKPRNVGVIGVAVYEQDEAAARRAREDEARRRDLADPYPG